MNEETSIAFKAIEDAYAYVSQAGPFVLTVLMVIVLRIALLYMPFVPKKTAPAITLATSVTVFVLLGDPGEAPFTMRFPMMRHAILGAFGWLVAAVVYQKLLRKWIEEKLVTGSGDTEHFKKPQ